MKKPFKRPQLTAKSKGKSAAKPGQRDVGDVSRLANVLSIATVANVMTPYKAPSVCDDRLVERKYFAKLGSPTDRAGAGATLARAATARIHNELVTSLRAADRVDWSCGAVRKRAARSQAMARTRGRTKKTKPQAPARTAKIVRGYGPIAEARIHSPRHEAPG